MKNKQPIFIMLIITIIFGTLNVNILSGYAAEMTRQSMNVKKTLVAPIIDGMIDESMWTVNEPLTVKLGNGEAQGTTFGMLWDNKYLYIAVDVEDDNLVHDGEGAWFQQDNISMFFDPTSHQSSPYVDSDMQIGLVYQPDSTTPVFHFGAAPNHASKNESDILRAIQTTEKGWSAEIAVPWEMLDFDPILSKQLGFEVNATDRDEVVDAPFSAWSAYQSSSFWNDTSGYGMITLDEETVSGTVNDVLIDEDFNTVEAGTLPFGWTSHSNDANDSFEIIDGKLVFDGNASGKQARILAPVQWDDYTVEADMTFEEVLNGARWGALMVRASANGMNQYNQMAIRQNGDFEFAYRTSDDKWSIPFSGKWAQELQLNEEYTLKIRVVDNNVKEYIKTKNDNEFTVLANEQFDNALLQRGKVGLQGDQSKIAYDQFKVTRVVADSMTMDVPAELEALTGALEIGYDVQFSDGINESIEADRVKLYSSDESIIKVMDHSIYPIAKGKATVKAVYQNVEVEREITVTESSVGVTVQSLQHDDGYLLASTDEKVNLNTLSFNASFNDLTEGTITGEKLTWTTDSSDIDLTSDSIVAKQKGIYQLTAEQNGISTIVYLVVKGAEEEEYVIYEENFDEVADGEMPEGWERVGLKTGSLGVKDGGLEIDGTGNGYTATGVLLPEYLSLFGDYKIEADLTHLQANDSGRWHSIMYRLQNNDYPYYQMAVRQAAMNQNGVEFTERTPANGWNVMEKTSFSETISAEKMYQYIVKTKGNRVQHFINDMLLMNNDLGTAYSKGRIGFQAAGSKTKIDNIRVTLQLEELPEMPPKPGENFVTVAEPATSISLAPSVITEIQSSEDINKLTVGARPATAILHVNDQLDVTNNKGFKIASLESVLEKMDTKVIPAFAIQNEQTISPLTNYLKDQSLEDAFVLSINPDLVKKMREAYPMIRGIVEFSNSGNLTEDQLMDIRRTTNSNLSKIALLPQDLATKENISYLQKKLITVWVKEATNRNTTTVDIHKMITAGPNGMVIKNAGNAIDALELYANNTTLVRKPLMVGHRGIPALAPENTLEGAILAYEKGADVIENDIYLTKDGEIIIMHDGTIDRTTNGTGNVEDKTLAELKELLANKQFPNDERYSDTRIPTLEEFFVEFKGKDVDHFVEIKSYKPEIVDALVELIEKHGVENQVSVISFNGDQLKRLGEKMPVMSGGILTGGVASDTNINPSLRESLKLVQNLNSTFNTSYSGFGKGFMEAAKHRGLTFWPWTYRNQDDFNKYFLFGTNGLTTDYNHWASDWAAQISPEQSSYEMNIGDTVEVGATIDTYDRQTKEITPEIILLDGNDKLTVNGNEVTANGAGTFHALLRYTHEMDAANKYDIYTQPITLTIKSNNSGGSSGGSGGGSGKPEQPSTGDQLIVDSNALTFTNSKTADGKDKVIVAVDLEKINESLKNKEKVEKVIVKAIEGSEAVEVKLPLQLITEIKVKNEQAVIEIQTEEGSFVIPVNEINSKALVAQLGGEADKVNINIHMSIVEDSDNVGTEKKLTFVSSIVDFYLEATAGNQKVDMNHFSQYIERTITGTSNFNSNTSVVVRLNEDGSFTAVPTMFNGKEATFKSFTNSKYVVVENKDVSFSDVSSNHWASGYIEKLASKYIVKGTSDMNYSPKEHTTRAQFAVLLTRSLGLPTTTSYNNQFKDVKGSEWYNENGELQAAIESGILKGNPNGTFAPNKAITRAEAATMISRALEYVSFQDEKLDQTKKLTHFNDKDRIANWAAKDVEKALQAGIFTGDQHANFNAQSFTKRDEVAKVIHNMLQIADFMN